jgi:hypothetical protein
MHKYIKKRPFRQPTRREDGQHDEQSCSKIPASSTALLAQLSSIPCTTYFEHTDSGDTMPAEAIMYKTTWNVFRLDELARETALHAVHFLSRVTRKRLTDTLTYQPGDLNT